MPNIKSAKKRVKVIKAKSLSNQMQKNNLKTSLKKFLVTVDAGDKEVAKAAYAQACSKVDKAVNKGILHANSASRKKKTMQSLLANM